MTNNNFGAVYNALEKAERLADIEIQKRQKIAACNYDLQIKKEARANILEIADGRWIVSTKLFDNTRYAHQFANFRNLSITCFRPFNYLAERRIYRLCFLVDTDEEVHECLIDVHDMSSRKLKNIMVQSGVRFYVKPPLLNALVDQFAANIVDLAEEIELPLKYGWFRCGSSYSYAKSGEAIWREVENIVKNGN